MLFPGCILYVCFSFTIGNMSFPLLSNLKPWYSLVHQHKPFSTALKKSPATEDYEVSRLVTFSVSSQVDSNYADLPKVLNNVNHSILLSKLRAFGYYDGLDNSFTIGNVSFPLLSNLMSWYPLVHQH